MFIISWEFSFICLSQCLFTFFVLILLCQFLNFIIFIHNFSLFCFLKCFKFHLLEHLWVVLSFNLSLFLSLLGLLKYSIFNLLLNSSSNLLLVFGKSVSFLNQFLLHFVFLFDFCNSLSSRIDFLVEVLDHTLFCFNFLVVSNEHSFVSFYLNFDFI
jgi:hypothetical protein